MSLYSSRFRSLVVYLCFLPLETHEAINPLEGKCHAIYLCIPWRTLTPACIAEHYTVFRKGGGEGANDFFSMAGGPCAGNICTFFSLSLFTLHFTFIPLLGLAICPKESPR